MQDRVKLFQTDRPLEFYVCLLIFCETFSSSALPFQWPPDRSTENFHCLNFLTQYRKMSTGRIAADCCGGSHPAMHPAPQASSGSWRDVDVEKNPQNNCLALNFNVSHPRLIWNCFRNCSLRRYRCRRKFTFSSNGSNSDSSDYQSEEDRNYR